MCAEIGILDGAWTKPLIVTAAGCATLGYSGVSDEPNHGKTGAA